MVNLPKNASLAELQSYVAETELERGFAQESTLHKCLLLGEEIGELFKAVRAASNLGIDRSSTVSTIGEELADVLLFVVAIANREQVDLEVALREKEKRNRFRSWEKITR